MRYFCRSRCGIFEVRNVLAVVFFIGCLGCGIFYIWYVLDVVCLECSMLATRDVPYLGVLGCWMIGIRDVYDVG